MVDSAATPSRRTLEEVPGRVLSFLMAVGKSPPIRAALAQKGYTEEEHQLAWSLLAKLAKYSPAPQSAPFDTAVRNAVAELDAWDEPNFASIRAILARLHPEQAKFVFQDLAPKQGPEAVLAIATLLDRLDALDTSPDRKATRKADQAALATLTKRGYSKEERERLRALIKTTQTATMAEPPDETDRVNVLLELYGWINDWGTQAKNAIRRRDHLILLGLSKRKKGKRGGGGDEAPAPIAPTPTGDVGGSGSAPS